MYKIILASQSPRRKQILSEAGFIFSTDSVKVSEYIEENVNLKESILDCAETKGQAYIDKYNQLKSQDYLIISADTVVNLQGQVLGKPTGEQDALKKLRQLSGNTHSVITGVVIFDLANGRTVRFAGETEVRFRSLSDEEILNYISTGEPMDKAGAYGIQGEGRHFVESINGSWSNVVGFPIEQFHEVVKKNGWKLPRT